MSVPRTPAQLPPGHSARRVAGRALVFTGIATCVFVGFAWLTTQVHAVRSGCPWQDDPYHAVVSFTGFFVPGLAVLAGLRALLWRRREPLPTARVVQLLRAAEAVGLLVWLTVVTDVVALAVRADHRLWNARMPISVATLVIVAVAIGAASAAVWRAYAALGRAVPADGALDWLADLPPLVERITGGWHPTPRRQVVAVAERIARWPAWRGHLPAAAFALLLLVGGAISAPQSIQEGYPGALFAFFALTFAGSTYSGLAVANRYLHLAAVRPAANKVRRAGRVSFVLGCLALVPFVGLRDLIWPVLGLGQVHGIWQLWAITFGGGAAVAVAAFLGLLAASAYDRNGGGDDRVSGAEAR